MIEQTTAALPQRDITSTLPGFERADWALLSGPVGKLVALDHWATLSIAEKIEHERAAITDYLGKKDQTYAHELISLAQDMSPMPASQIVTIIMPAYNEQDNIG